MQIDEKKYNAMPPELQRLFLKLPNPGKAEVLAGFPETGPSSARVRHNGEFKSVAKGKDLPHDTFGHGDSGSAARFFYCAKASKQDRDEGLGGMPLRKCGMMEDDNYPIKTGSGNLRETSRHNPHPTVKPTSLMRYLVRLVTPPGGVVLDPFTGSGSTGKAAALEGFGFIGIELDPAYCDIARARIAEAQARPKQGKMFEEGT